MFEFSPKSRDLQKRLDAFMREHIYPNEARHHAEIEHSRWSPTRVIEELGLNTRIWSKGEAGRS